MFLEKLDEREKEVFLDLARLTAKANGVVDDDEKEMITRYCREMNISEFKIYDTKNLDEAAAFFAGRSNKAKNIVLVELLLLCSADGKKDKDEKQFVKDLAAKMDINKETYDILKEDVNHYRDFISEMKKHIKG